MNDSVTTNRLNCTPIGYFHSAQSEKYMAPRQPTLGVDAEGQIILSPGNNFEQALEDLEGFGRIWLIYWIHRNHTWKPKVTTPRGGPKRGVFATRSPHRPNPIGLSCVVLLGIKGRRLMIGKNDLLDGTPILDIKPYLSYADAFPESKQGWVGQNLPTIDYKIVWSEIALTQAHFIETHTGLKVIQTVELRLSENPFPFPNHRIEEVGEGMYELSFKTWRITYFLVEHVVTIHHISSGYDSDSLNGLKMSRWNDVPLHLEFIKRFS